MHWTQRQRGVTNLGEALHRRGWSLYGYSPDQSEAMTDYYHPASWLGIAEKDGFVVVVDVAPGSSLLKSSGGRPRSERVKDKDCEHCGGTGCEPDGWTYDQAVGDVQGYRRWILATKGVVMTPVIGSIVDQRDFVNDRYKCGQCFGIGYTSKEITVTEPWPTFHANPVRKVWHVEKAGLIYASGTGLAGWGDYDRTRSDAAVAQTIRAIEYGMRRASRPAAGSSNSSSAASVDGVRVRRNDSLNGIEVIFPTKPSYETRQSLKDLRFRWSSAQGLWYARYSDSTWRRVHDLLGVEPGEDADLDETEEALEEPVANQAPCPPGAAEFGCPHEQGCTDEIKDRYSCPFPRQITADAASVPAYTIVEPLTGEPIGGSNNTHDQLATTSREFADAVIDAFAKLKPADRADEDWSPDGRPEAVQSHDYVPARIRARIPKLYRTDNKPHDEIIVWLKFFTPDSSYTWYLWEFDGDDTMFGLTIGHEMELGYVSLSEIRETTGPMGLHVERDIWWKPQPLCQIPEYAEWSGADPGLRARHHPPKPAHNSAPECGLLPARPTIARTNRSLQGGDDAWLKIVVRPKPGCSIPVVIWNAMTPWRYEWEAAREAWTTDHNQQAWDEVLAADTEWVRLERAAAEAAESHIALTPEMIAAAAANEGQCPPEGQPENNQAQPLEPTPSEPQPWEMGQRQYMLSKAACAGGVPICNAADREAHEAAVRRASAQGLPVPPDVLGEYGLAAEDIIEVLDVYGRTYRVSRHDYLQPAWTQVRLYARKSDVLLGRLPEDDPEYRQSETVTMARENIARVLTPLAGVDPAPDPAKAAAAEEQASRDVTIGDVCFAHFATDGGHLEYTYIVDGVGWTVFRVTPRPAGRVTPEAKPWWVAEVHKDDSVRCLNCMLVDEDQVENKDPLYDETDDGETDPPMKLLAGIARLIAEGYDPFAPKPATQAPSPVEETPAEEPSPEPAMHTMADLSMASRQKRARNTPETRQKCANGTDPEPASSVLATPLVGASVETPAVTELEPVEPDNARNGVIVNASAGQKCDRNVREMQPKPATNVAPEPASGPPAATSTWTILTPVKWKNGWPVASGGTIRVQDNTGQIHLVTPFPPKMWCMTCKSDSCPAGQTVLDGKPAAKQARGKAA